MDLTSVPAGSGLQLWGAALKARPQVVHSSMPESSDCWQDKLVIVIVAYANADALGPRLTVVPNWPGRVIVVDNRLAAATGNLSLTGEVDATVLPNANVGGLAGAYNRAIAEILSWPNRPEYVLYLDDDSDFSAVWPFLDSFLTRAATADFEVAAVAPAYVDPTTGISGAPIRLGHWTWRALSRNLAEPTDVSFLINSMSLWKWSALQRIGNYRTDLGVDHVDTDYCLRAQALGYRLVLNPAVKFLHPIGARRQYRFLGKTFQAGGHTPARRKSIARNTVLLARQYGGRWPSFVLLCLSRLAYEALGIVMAESGKVAKLGALCAGAFAGLTARAPSGQDTRPRPQ